MTRLKQDLFASTSLQPSKLRRGRRWVYGLGMAAMLAAAAPAGAIVLNDGDAEQAGGIDNYYDRDNVLGNVVSLFSPWSGTFCTGSLINSRTILTASHCVIRPGGIYPVVGQSEIHFGPVSH